MIRHYIAMACVAAAVILGSGVAACGNSQGEEPLPCGSDTIFKQGQCVPMGHDCKEGEVVSPSGRCEDPNNFCGEGAEYDFEAQKCVTDSGVVCGRDTVEEDGYCVPVTPYECGEGTVLADGICVLEEEACGQGTQPVGDEEISGCELSEEVCADGAQFDVEEGKCIVADAVACGEGTVQWEERCIAQRTAADLLATEATLDYADDTAIVASEDEPVVFTGTMDEELRHSFPLVAEAGQWLEVTLYPRGLPSPGFSITDGEGWKRATVPGLVSLPSRTFGVPESAIYDFEVTTTVSDLENAEDFGDETWQYVGVVEVVEPPAASDWQEAFNEPTTGELKTTQSNSRSVDVGDSEHIVVTANHLGADARGAVVELWSQDGEFRDYAPVDARGSVLFETGGESSVVVHFDAEKFVGERTEFEVRARSAQVLADEEVYTETVSAEAGEVIFLSHRSDERHPVAGAVYMDGQLQYEVDEILAKNLSFFDTEETMRQFFYVPEDGDYVVEFENNSGEDLHQFAGVTVVEEVPTFELEAGEDREFEAHILAEELGNGDWRLVLIDTSTAAFIDGLVRVGEGEPGISVFNTQGDELFSRSGHLEENEFGVELDTPGVHFLAIRPNVTSGLETTTEISGGIDVELQGRSVEALYPGEVETESWDVDASDVLVGNLFYESGQGVDLRLVDSSGDTVFERSGVDSGVELAEIFPDSGEFSLEVENTTDEAILGIEVETEAATPVDDISVDEAFDLSYDRPPLDGGQSEYYLLRSQADFLMETRSFVDSEERAILRLWNVDEPKLMKKIRGEDIIILEEPRFAQGDYILEVEAATDIGADWEQTIGGSEVEFIDVVKEENPPMSVGTFGGVDESHLSVSGCSDIADVWISVEFVEIDDLEHYEYLFVTLTKQGGGGDDPIVLYDGEAETLSTTVFGKDRQPQDSLEDLVGNSGDGVWELTVENEHCCDESQLISWGVHLSCAAI